MLIFFSIGIGDSLLVTPALQDIQKFKEEFEIDALVMSKQIFAIMQGLAIFDNVYLIDFLNQSIFISISQILRLRRRKYISSIQTFPSNHFKYRFVHFLLGAKERVGHDYLETPFPHLAFFNNSKVFESGNEHAVAENYKLFEKLFKKKLPRNKKLLIRLDEASIDFANFYFKNNILAEKETFCIGIHAGSDHFKNLIHKRWSPQYFADLIDLLLSEFKDKKDKSLFNQLKFLFFGVGDEVLLNKQIVELVKHKKNCLIASKTSFMQAAALVSKCNLFISNDSGLMHTATSLNIPILTIFGPTSEVFASPWKVKSCVVSSKDKCRPCFGYSKTALQCENKEEYRCLLNLFPQDVLKESRNFLDELLYVKK